MYSTFSTGRGFWEDTNQTYQYEQIQRSNSNIQQRDEHNRTLKLAGKNTIGFPKRKRFNENTEETIKEMKSSASNAKLNMEKIK